MELATNSAASQVAQPFTAPSQSLGQITKGRSDPAQWVTEIGEKRLKLAFMPLESVTKPNLTTAEAAYYLNRCPQTLRAWAMRDGSGPIRPRRIGGLLAWSTQEIKALAGVQA